MRVIIYYCVKNLIFFFISQDLFNYHNIDAEKRFTPKDLMAKVSTLACVIDLTAMVLQLP
jgi:hypothetical protein